MHLRPPMASIVALVAACGDAEPAGERFVEPALCGSARVWTVDNTDPVDAAVLRWRPTTDASGRLCFPTANGGACQGGDGPNEQWSDDSANERTIVVADTRGVYRVSESNDGIVVRDADGDDNLACRNLFGAYTIDGCVGVVAGACGDAVGTFLHVRDASGDWSRSDAMPIVQHGAELSIAPVSCHRGLGVWRSGPGSDVIGPTLLGFVDGTFTERMLGDVFVPDAMVDPRTGDVLALHNTGSGTDQLRWYHDGVDNQIVTQSQMRRVSDDFFQFGKLTFTATTPRDAVVFAETADNQSFGLGVATQAGGTWTIQSLDELVASATGSIPAITVWSSAYDESGDLIVDLGVGPSPGHTRLRGTCPPPDSE